MRYLPTLDLWANRGVLQTAIRSGQLKIQPGQWLQCGPGSKSRFVCVRPGGSIWAVHADESGGVPTARFSNCCLSWQGK